MSDEIVNVKYPNRNAQSFVFNSSLITSFLVSIVITHHFPFLNNKKTNYFQLAFIT